MAGWRRPPLHPEVAGGRPPPRPLHPVDHLPPPGYRPPHTEHGAGRLDGRPDRYRKPAGQAPLRGVVPVPHAVPQPVHVRRYPAPARLRHLRPRLQRPPDHRRGLRPGALGEVTLMAGPRGRRAMPADDYGTSVTVEFRWHEIAIWDGERPPLDASIVGPYRGLTRLLQGETNPLVEHLRGRLRVRSTLRKPLFPFHVHSLMKLPPEAKARRNHLTSAALLTAGGFALGGVIALALR